MMRDSYLSCLTIIKKGKSFFSQRFMSRAPRNLWLYLLYIFLGGFLAAEPTLLKLLCQTYLPGFDYRLLTVPTSAILVIAAIQQWRIYRGHHPITGAFVLRQLNSRSFTQNCVAGASAIRRTVSLICQDYADFGLKLWEGGQIRYQFWRQILVHAVDWVRVLLGSEHQPPENSHSHKIATEPMARVWLNRTYRYFLLAEFSQLLLLTYIIFSFWQKVPRWGWLDTSLNVAWEALFFFLCIYMYDLISINALKSQRLANQSGQDLLELAEMLGTQKPKASSANRELATEGWQFEYRVILSQTKKFSQWKKCSLESLISRLPDLSPRRGDIDVLAISPDGYYFVIELKSHVGEVVWNSEKKTIYRRLGTDPKPIPFKEGDLLDQVKGQARRLQAHRQLSQFPERILVFWRAKVCIPENKRLKRGVLISDRSRLIKDLKKRNRQLVKKAKKGEKKSDSLQRTSEGEGQ